MNVPNILDYPLDRPHRFARLQLGGFVWFIVGRALTGQA